VKEKVYISFASPTKLSLIWQIVSPPGGTKIRECTHRLIHHNFGKPCNLKHRFVMELPTIIANLLWIVQEIHWVSISQNFVKCIVFGSQPPPKNQWGVKYATKFHPYWCNMSNRLISNQNKGVGLFTASILPEKNTINIRTHLHFGSKSLANVSSLSISAEILLIRHCHLLLTLVMH